MHSQILQSISNRSQPTEAVLLELPYPASHNNSHTHRTTMATDTVDGLEMLLRGLALSTPTSAVPGADVLAQPRGHLPRAPGRLPC